MRRVSRLGLIELSIGGTLGLLAGPILFGDTLTGTMVLLAGLTLGEMWSLRDPNEEDDGE